MALILLGAVYAIIAIHAIHHVVTTSKHKRTSPNSKDWKAGNLSKKGN